MLGKAFLDASNQGGWLILNEWVTDGVTSDPHDFNLHIDIFSPYLNVSRSIADLYSGFKKLEGLFTYLVKQI